MYKEKNEIPERRYFEYMIKSRTMLFRPLNIRFGFTCENFAHVYVAKWKEDDFPFDVLSELSFERK